MYAPTSAQRLVRLLFSLTAITLIAAGCSNSTDSDAATAPTSTSPELVLEAALSPGVDPFTESASTLEDPEIAAATTVEHDEVELADTTGEPNDAAAAIDGTTPGLYGGTGDNGTCDTAAISAHLGADDAKAQAWADAQGIGVHGIDPFLDTLTPVVLLHDTRVTNHGYSEGHATPFQAVLQAGTAVLVDPEGVPRVRCACGNPLDQPDTSTALEPTGTSWNGFGDTPTVVVTPATPTNVFVVINIYTGDSYEVPAGGDIADPADDSETSGGSAGSTTTTTAVVEDDQLPDRDATTCLSRYAELVVLMTPLGLDPLQAAQWAPRAAEAGALIDAGQLEEATEVICSLVDEMEVEYQNLLGGP